MGTWGSGILENDSAMDFVYEVEENAKASFFKKPRLFEFLHQTVGDYLATLATTSPDPMMYNEPEACAAAFIIAGAAEGNLDSTIENPEPIIKALRGHKRLPELLEMALRACDGIRADTSELSLLWAGPGVDPQDCLNWRNAMDKLRARLGQLNP